jgi:hypothetical protein
VAHSDDTTPDPMKLPLDDLDGAMPLDDEPVAAGSAALGEPDALIEEPVAEPTDPKSKKLAEKARKKREKEEAARKAKEEKEAKARAKKDKKGKKAKGTEGAEATEEGEAKTDETEAEADADAEAEAVLVASKGKKPKKAMKEKKEKKGRKEKKPVVAVAKGPSVPLMTRLRRASPYTVMLAIGCGSLAVAISFLVLYLSTYNFTIKP